MARNDLHYVKDLEFVTNAELEDGLLTVTMDGKAFTIMVDEYPRGEPQLFGDQFEILKRGRLDEVVRQVYETHCSGSGMQSREQSTYVVVSANTGADLIKKDRAVYESKFGAGTTSMEELGASAENFVLSVRFTVAGLLTEHTASAWGAKTTSPITLAMRFDSREYTDQGQPPRVELTQDGQKFPLGQQLTRILQVYLRVRWPKGWAQNDTVASAHGAKKKTHSVTIPAHKKPIHKSLLEMGYQVSDCDAVIMIGNSVEECVEHLTNPSLLASAKQQHQMANAVPMQDVASALENPERYDADTDPVKQCSFLLDEGFLVHIVSYLLRRIPSCSRYCVICDKPHTFGAGSMIKPACCSRNLCVFAFQELNVGTDSAESVATEIGVVDLLITVFRAAALSARHKDVLNPFPQVVHAQDPRKLALDPEKPDYDLMRKIMNDLPTAAQLSQAEDMGSLKTSLATKSPLAFPLVQWIVASNRSHIVKMRKEHHMPSMVTEHQYLMITASPEKEAVFNNLKAKHGTKFAFHGSNAENWHNILRNGLRNASGTKLQLHGTAHGKGIYFAPQAQSSIGYCQPAQMAKGKDAPTSLDFINTQGMICLALCEIVDKEIKDHGWCWTLENEDHCITRFLFVFDKNNQDKAGAADSKDARFVKEVQKAMEHYGL